MSQEAEILQLPERACAALRLRVARGEIRTAMGPAIGEVYRAIQTQGLTPSGPWYTHHFRRPTDTFDMEVCVPIDGTFAPAGRVYPARWPAMKVARTFHAGPYEGLAEAWGRFIEALARRELRTADELYEVYLVGPESGPDPARWRTELIRPLAG